MDDDKVVKAIVHYQQNLEKYIERRHEAKMIHCMEKLQKLPITVSHLEHTGVGRTVNSVRKMKGIKGSPKNTAKQLVQQWKKMVTEEEDESDEEESEHEDDDDDDDEDSEDRLQIYCETDDVKDNEDKDELQKETRNIEIQDSSHYDHQEFESNKYGKYRDKYSESEHKYCDSDRIGFEHLDVDDSRETRTVKHTSPDCNYDDEYGHFYSATEKDNEYDYQAQRDQVSDEELKVDKQKEDREDKYKKKSSSSSSSSRDRDRQRDRDRDKERERDKDRERSVDKYESKDRHRDKEKRRSNEKDKDRDRDRDREKDKEKENHHENGHRKSSSSEKHDKHRHSSHKSSKSSSSSKEKETKINKDSAESKDTKEKDTKESNGRSRDREKDKEQSQGHVKDRDKSKSHESTSRKSSTTPSTPTSSLTPSSKKRSSQEDKSSPAKKLKLSITDGIDCESGASFAEALGIMMMPSTSKGKKDTKEKEKEKDSKDRGSSKDHCRESSRDKSKDRHKEHKSSKHREKDKERDKDREKEKEKERSDRKHDKSKGSSSGGSSGGSSSSNKKDDKTPAGLLTPLAKLTPLEDVGISNLLPQISTNYKPLGFPPGDGHRPGATKAQDDEMLSKLMYAKNQRTKVYSGNKVFYGKVPSLFECCIRLLQDNIDTLALGFTGGVPYSILKPVLERATPSQLFNMEHYNTYLMDESDELWQFHVQREFKTKIRNEMETWREMYLRCIDERDAKLKSLTANIKLSQDKSLPVRQTKLAYVDSMAKPPRGVAKKQQKNGISSSRPSITPSSRLNQLATAGGVSVPNPGATRVNSGNGGGGGGPSGNNYVVKPKKAPLMAKTLQLMKGRFRR